jgi:alpha-glucuronidase
MTAATLQRTDRVAGGAALGEEGIEDLREAAQEIARVVVSDAVTKALADFGGSLRDFQRISGIQPASLSKLARGQNVQGGTVASLAQIALALDKNLRISFD